VRSEEQLKKLDLFSLEKTRLDLICLDLVDLPVWEKVLKDSGCLFFSKACYGARQAFSVQQPQERFGSLFLMTRNFPHHQLDLN